MTEGVRCMLMRGGTSKGAYFLAEDLPSDPLERDDLLLRLMGSPDARQIDGIGGGHPLTSKVAVVSGSAEGTVDYRFLQVVPDRAVVSGTQTCGNLLAGVGPFALERGLVSMEDDWTRVRIRLLNPVVAFAEARVQTPAGSVRYDGSVVMAGAPFPAAPVELTFPGAADSAYPTGRLVDVVDGVEVTCVDAGMPVVVVRAQDLGRSGDETPEVLEADPGAVEAIRSQAGRLMGLDDLTTVPKVCLVSESGGSATIRTRTYIPHRVHAAIGVLAGVSVATAALTPGTVAQPLASSSTNPVRLEHPGGIFEVRLELALDGPGTRVRTSSVIRTARKLFDGTAWPREAS